MNEQAKTGHVWQEASAWAARAHRNQVRKDGRTPYASHPARVAMTVATVFGVQDEEIIAAAFLHDTIEDTTTDYDDLLQAFGRRVADIVACVSKDMRMEEKPREIAYDQQMEKGPWEARLVKLGDVYDNVIDAMIEGGKRLTDALERGDRALKMSHGDARLAKAVEAVTVAMRRARAGIEPQKTQRRELATDGH